MQKSVAAGTEQKVTTQTVTTESGKKFTIVRNPNRTPVKVGHLPTDREWSR